jgi:hypothetical protein
MKPKSVKVKISSRLSTPLHLLISNSIIDNCGFISVRYVHNSPYNFIETVKSFTVINIAPLTSFSRDSKSSDGKFPEIFTGGNFPETFPTVFAHRFLLAYFLP